MPKDSAIFSRYQDRIVISEDYDIEEDSEDDLEDSELSKSDR